MISDLVFHPFLVNISLLISFSNGDSFFKCPFGTTVGHFAASRIVHVKVEVFDDRKICPKTIIEILQDVGLETNNDDIQIYQYRQKDGALDDGYSINDLLV